MINSNDEFLKSRFAELVEDYDRSDKNKFEIICQEFRFQVLSEDDFTKTIKCWWFGHEDMAQIFTLGFGMVKAESILGLIATYGEFHDSYENWFYHWRHSGMFSEIEDAVELDTAIHNFYVECQKVTKLYDNMTKNLGVNVDTIALWASDAGY